MVEINFDSNNVEPLGEFEAIPAGKYLAAIVESGYKLTKAGNGKYLELKFQIIDGQFKGRNLWSRLNLQNPSLQAVQIAQSELSSICRAVGVLTLKDTAELHNLPLVISVKQKPDASGEMRNEIKNYAKRELSVAVTAAAPGNAQTAAPWKRS